MMLLLTHSHQHVLVCGIFRLLDLSVSEEGRHVITNHQTCQPIFAQTRDINA